MDYSKIIVVSGKSGTFKIMAQSRGGIIAESLTDGKKMPIAANSKVTSIEDIVIFTETDEVKLKEVFKNMKKLADEGTTFSNKVSDNEIKASFEQILPEYDKDRVYVSDMKKIILWFNQLNEHNLIVTETEEEKPAENESNEKAE